MPDLTTHLLFGIQVKRDLLPPIRQAIHLHPGVFAFGTQGPDLFFFRKTIPHNNPIHTYGSILHKQKVCEALNYFKNYLSVHHKEPDGSILLSYFAGYLCHYYLDSILHPYVYYLTARRKQTSRKHSSAIHAQIEAELDYYFYHTFSGKPVRDFQFKPYFNISEQEKQIVTKFYQSLLHEVYDIAIKSRDMIRCFYDFVNVSAMFFERPKAINRVGNAISKIYHPAQIISAHIKKTDCPSDTANLSHRIWHHPLYPWRVSSESVVDLFECARKTLIKNLNLCYETLDQNGLPFEITKDFSGNDL